MIIPLNLVRFNFDICNLYLARLNANNSMIFYSTGKLFHEEIEKKTKEQKETENQLEVEEPFRR